MNNAEFQRVDETFEEVCFDSVVLESKLSIAPEHQHPSSPSNALYRASLQPGASAVSSHR